MPFATLPSSPGFQAPQAPSWEPFALEAIRARERQPVPNTAEMVNQAVQQIDHILQLSSPQAKLQREVQTQHLQAMSELYKNYKAHPERYKMTANGPVLEDPVERIGKIANARAAVARANYLNKKTKGGDTPAFIKTFMDKMRTIDNAEKQGVSIPSSKQPTVESVAEVPNAAPTNDTTEADVVAVGSPTEDSSVTQPYNEETQ